MGTGVSLGSIAAALCFLMVPGPTVADEHPLTRWAANLDPLTRWAFTGIRHAEGPQLRPTATTMVQDHFGRTPYATRPIGSEGLAGHLRRLGTAGSGSFWVYDPVHHIAAASEYGDIYGDRLLYAPAPPGSVPQRDLSRVVSAHGLRLGTTIRDAARILHVSPSAVRRFGTHTSVLFARANRRCGRMPCAHDANVVFTDGRATGITLADIGP